jgi:hypothetical protein
MNRNELNSLLIGAAITNLYNLQENWINEQMTHNNSLLQFSWKTFKICLIGLVEINLN